MSVNTSEEYLDELLQAIEPIIYKNEPETVVVNQTHTSMNSEVNQMENGDGSVSAVEATPIEDMPAAVELTEDFGISDIPAEVDSASFDSPVAEDGISLDNLITDDSISLEQLVAETAEEALPANEANEEVSMDDLLAALTSEDNAGVEEMDVDAMLSAAAGAVTEADAYDPSTHNNDVKELLKQFSDDEDLSDIGEILERDDNSEAVDESVLLTPDVEVFQLEESAEEEEETEPVKEKKGFFSRFKKNKRKKKKGQDEATEEVPSVNRETTEVEDSAAIDLLMPEEPAYVDQSPRSDVSVDMDTMDIGALMNLGDAEVTPTGEGELDLGNLFGDGDMADIDQLLAAGSFEEIGTDELIRDADNAKTDDSNNGKKGSFFSRFLNMLLEEDEEEEEKEKKKSKKGHVPEADETGVTDENLGILEELSKEDKKKAKKEKKEQKKKEKEAKKKGKNAPEGEGEPEGEEGAEGEDKKKKKKIKKEKPRKVVDIDQKPEKKLSRKKVSTVFLFCFSILAVILLFKNVVLDLSNLKDARWAFDNADYETCYANLYGEELSEEDEAIFQKSYVILCVQRKLDSYENFIRMDMGVEALNALFDGVRVYRNMEQRASELGILDRIAVIYQSIYAKLGDYGLSNEEIEEILDYESKVTYTKRLESIVNGTPFVVEEISIPEAEPVAEPEPQPLEDVLPQEEDFLPDDTTSLNTTASAPENEKPQTTVVVGSSPVDVSVSSGEGNNTGGENVGSGDTNVSATVNGDNVVVF